MLAHAVTGMLTPSELVAAHERTCTTLRDSPCQRISKHSYTRCSDPARAAYRGLFRYNVSDAMPGDVYQFGVFTGASLRSLARHYRGARLWAFDTFSGMPKVSDHTEGSYIKAWGPGAFNAAGSSRDKVKRLQEEFGAQGHNVSFIVGTYSVSLTTQLPQAMGMRPAMYVDIDCDLYASTLEALDWMLAHNLIIAGTVLGYDDCALTGNRTRSLSTRTASLPTCRVRASAAQGGTPRA